MLLAANQVGRAKARVRDMKVEDATPHNGTEDFGAQCQCVMMELGRAGVTQW